MNAIHVQRLEGLLRTGQWCCLGGAAWIAVNALLLRPAPPLPELHSVAHAAEPAIEGSAVQAAAQWSTIWERDLRQDLLPPRPKEAVKPPPPPPPPPVKLPRLLATFVEGGKSFGLFIDAAGGQRVRTAGEKIDDMEIEAIRPGECTLRKGERSHDVRVVKGADPGRSPGAQRGE